MTTTTLTGPATIAHDHVGRLTVSDGIAYYLTPCCGASGKGSAGSRTGVVCRSCYSDMAADFGDGWLVSDSAAWERYAERFVSACMEDPEGRVLSAEVLESNRAVLVRAAARIREAAAAV